VSKFARTPRSLSSIDLNLDDIDFDDDASQKLLLALVLDTSQSMEGEPIGLLNDALQELSGHLRQDKQLRSIARVAIITFGHGGVTAWQGAGPAAAGASPFVPVQALSMPTLPAGGVTPMVEAVQHAIYWVKKEKESLRSRGLQYYRPLVWLISDGVPTDSRGRPSEDWRHLAKTLRRSENEDHVIFLTVSAGDISAEGDAVLRALSPRGHVRIGFDFAPVLRLVSSSAGRFARGGSVDAFYEQVEQFQQYSVEW
jgi:uncharacterized protein YegL